MIVFDLQAVQSAAHGERGIARYVSDLAATLAGEHPDVVDVFAWNDLLPHVPRLDELDLGDRLRPFSELRNADVDVLHVNSPFELLEYGSVGVPVKARKLVVTCYDLIPYRFPDRYFTDPVARARYRTRLNMLVAADAVVTDSQSAADDVAELLGVSERHLTVIGAGVGPQFRPPSSSLEERMTALRRTIPDLVPRFVLVPAGIDWRKNIEGVIDAFGRLPDPVREQRQLVLSCKVVDQERSWVEELAAAAGIEDRLIVTGYVSDEVLVMLYQTAELVLFPSFYEGFGLPVLEARRCGARVICSNTSSLPEVLPDERALFNPWVPDEVATALREALVDPELGAALDRIPDSGFTWERAAKRLVGVYEQLQASTVPRRPAPSERGRTKRLGIVTLLPPTLSGIADHSRRLVDAIHHGIDGVDVTVFVERLASWSAELPYPVHDLATLPAWWLNGELDDVLYCFGNNQLHRSFYPMISIVPGHALLHDVVLVGAYDQRRINLLARDVYDGNLDGSAIFAKPISLVAESVMVQSAHAADLYARDGGGTAIDVGPHPCEVVASTDRISDGALPWVITAGIAHESKQSHLVAEAMGILVEHGLVRAAIVGSRGEKFVDDADDAVIVTGHVDDEEFDEWLRRADVLVQLRGTSNGESSGVAAHALARGVPLIVTDIGAMSELPADACVKVAVDVTAAELAATIERVIGSPDLQASMRTAGLAFAARETPLAQARRIVDVIFGSDRP